MSVVGELLELAVCLVVWAAAMSVVTASLRDSLLGERSVADAAYEISAEAPKAAA